jgi:hypothetical protein
VEGQGFSPATKTTARSASLCAAFLAACTRIPALESTTYSHHLRQPNGARSTLLNRPIWLKGGDSTAATNDDTQPAT